jgi:hypothetical protein
VKQININESFIELKNHKTGDINYFSSEKGLYEFLKWRQEKGISKLNIQDEALEIAEEEFKKGVYEITPNDSPEIKEYLKSVGINNHSPWCLAFVYWCVDNACFNAGKKNPLPKSGYCPITAKWGISENIKSNTPEPGDIFFLMDSQIPPYYHTGFVSGVKGEYFETIEGNTNPGGSAEGDGIYKRTRLNSNVIFIKWYVKVI